MTEKPEDKIVRLMRDNSTGRLGAANQITVSVSGEGNFVAGGDLHVYQQAPKPARRQPVQPGVVHITEEHRRILKRLVGDIGETEGRLKKSPKVYGAVYAALFKRFEGVNKLEQIPLSGFDEARSYLHQWLGRLNSMPSAPVKNVDDWRKRRYAFIKVNTKADEDAAALTSYIKRNFSAESLTELSNDELEKAYRYVAQRKRRRF